MGSPSWRTGAKTDVGSQDTGGRATIPSARSFAATKAARKPLLCPESVPEGLPPE